MHIKNTFRDTLRFQLIFQHILLTGIMALLCLSLFVWAQIDNMHFKEMLEYKSLLNNYFTVLNQMQTGISAYNDTSDMGYLTDVHEKISLAVKQADDLRQFYDSPQFVDQYYITCTLEQTLNNVSDGSDQAQTAKDAELTTAAYIVSLLLNNEYNIIAVENTIFEDHFSQINRRHSIQLVFALMITAIIIIGCFVLSLRLSSRMISPLEVLTGQVKKASRDLLEYTPAQQVNSVNEISILSETFDSMVIKLQSQMLEIQEKMHLSEQLKQLELQNMRKDMLLLESELRAVQSLINPHFLYNSLGIISSLTYLENAPMARDATQKISRFLRDSFHDVGKIVTIGDEIQRLQNYLDIQKLRFAERIGFQIQYDENILAAGVPAMTLQPIVENSIIHGMREREEDGFVHILLSKTDCKIQLQIIDNGIGMDEDTIAGLTRGGMPGENAGIGLRSVLLQLRMCFSDAVSTSIESTPMEYTCVCISFPEMPPEKIKPGS